jgi:hypothetical protein
MTVDAFTQMRTNRIFLITLAIFLQTIGSFAGTAFFGRRARHWLVDLSVKRIWVFIDRMSYRFKTRLLFILPNFADYCGNPCNCRISCIVLNLQNTHSIISNILIFRNYMALSRFSRESSPLPFYLRSGVLFCSSRSLLTFKIIN